MLCSVNIHSLDYVLPVIGGFVGMGLVLDAWIGKRERKVMRETLTTTWLALAEANPAVIA